MLAPAAAIASRDGKDVAFVVADERVSQRALKLGRLAGDDREVLDGLAGGDTVVLDPPRARPISAFVSPLRPTTSPQATDDSTRH